MAEHTNWPKEFLQQKPIDRVFVCGRHLEPPLYSHVVNFPRLEIPLGGCYENRIEVNGVATTVRLMPGTALFAPPNCWNLPSWRHPVRLISLLFGKKQLGVSIVTAKGRGPGLIADKFSQPLPLTGPIPKILDAMIEIQAAGGPCSALAGLAQALLECVQHTVVTQDTKALNPAKSLFEDVCVFLQNHYQYDISRASVARHFNVSPNYLSRVFQVQGHMTFRSYLMHVRTDRAKHLLRNYNLKLDDIAARCGYRDTAYFCRVFRAIAKTTAANYRAQYKVASPASPA